VRFIDKSIVRLRRAQNRGDCALALRGGIASSWHSTNQRPDALHVADYHEWPSSYRAFLRYPVSRSRQLMLGIGRRRRVAHVR
jgi:hypothetical protein